MSRVKKQRSGLDRRIPVFGTLIGLCFSGVLTAMSIVLGKFLQIPNPFQEFIRISFENLPIMIAGISLGPIAGMIVGTVADLVGCVLYGYAINWRITLGSAMVGLVSGVVAKIIKNPRSLSIIISVCAAHLIGSVLIKSWGLAKWYLDAYELGYWEFVLWRLVNYSFIAILECVLICLLFKNSAFRKQIERLERK